MRVEGKRRVREGEMEMGGEKAEEGWRIKGVGGSMENGKEGRRRRKYVGRVVGR